MESKRERAKLLFEQGFNCAQAVSGAFAEEMGLEQHTVFKLTSSFGGGMGRLREVCGAVSGMFFVAGMLYGYDDPKAIKEKSEHYERIQKLAAVFKEKNSSFICRELLGLPKGADRPEPFLRTEAYYVKRPCGELVADAAEILEQYIQQNPQK